MIGRDQNAQRTCYSKLRYGSKADARQAARRTNRRGDGREHNKVYVCKLCDGYHVGHMTPASVREENA